MRAIRKLCLLAAAVAAVVTSMPIWAYAAPATPNAIINTTPCFVYASPTPGAAVIGGFYEGNAVVASASGSGWYCVEYGAAKGYVPAAQVTLTNGAPGAKPGAKPGSNTTTATENTPALDFTAPIWVLNKGDMASMRVLAKPEPGAAAIGIVYGASVSITVLENLDNGYSQVSLPDYGTSKTITGYLPTASLIQVTPEGSYGIWIDKSTQSLTVYQEGKAVRTMQCSTGATSSETPVGTFLLINKRTYFTSLSNPEVIAEYPMRFYNRLYIHATPHLHGNYASFIRKLGSKASNGCVRIPLEDAVWMYNLLPYETKIIITE